MEPTDPSNVSTSLRCLTGPEASFFVSRLKQLHRSGKMGGFGAIAAKAGVHRVTLHFWLRGKPIGARKASEAAAALGLPPIHASKESDVVALLAAFRSSGQSDFRKRADIVNRCSSFLQDRLDREGVVCRVVLSGRKDGLATVIADPPREKFQVEILVNGNHLDYKLLRVEGSTRKTVGRGGVSNFGLQACVEFIKHGPARSAEGIPIVLSQGHQLRSLY